MSLAEDVADILKANRKTEDKIAALVEYIEGEFGRVDDVVVRGTKGAIGTVEAYGLVLQVDANGRAAEVHFPEGAYVE